MVDWEKRIRDTKFVVWSNVGPNQEFRMILVSQDIGEKIGLEGVTDTNNVFEGLPIKMDKQLPENSVVFIPVYV